MFKIIRLKDYYCPFVQMQETRSFDILIRSNDLNLTSILYFEGSSWSFCPICMLKISWSVSNKIYDAFSYLRRIFFCRTLYRPTFHIPIIINYCFEYHFFHITLNNVKTFKYIVPYVFRKMIWKSFRRD